MLSGQNKIEVALDTIRNGANDYVVKNDNAFLKILNIVRAAVKDFSASRKRMFYASWAAMAVSAICIISLGFVVYKMLFF
jgi:FixJ family two-component response regulator